MKPTGPVCEKGVRLLLGTQLEHGSWYVRSRAFPIQPYFDSGFPHGNDQFIPAAAPTGPPWHWRWLAADGQRHPVVSRRTKTSPNAYFSQFRNSPSSSRNRDQAGSSSSIK